MCEVIISHALYEKKKLLLNKKVRSAKGCMVWCVQRNYGRLAIYSSFNC